MAWLSVLLLFLRVEETVFTTSISKLRCRAAILVSPSPYTRGCSPELDVLTDPIVVNRLVDTDEQGALLLFESDRTVMELLSPRIPSGQ